MIDVYDRNRKKQAILQNARNVREEMTLNGVGSVSFELPESDQKSDYCLPFHLLRLDGGDFHRFIIDKRTRNTTGMLTYRTEHCIATLVDDLMFGAHIIGGLDISTRQVIEYILSFQTVKNWVLGECDFDYQFEYCFESENLLNALFSVANIFADHYQWVYDMSTYPWKVSLKRMVEDAAPQYYVRAGKNLISRDTDKTALNICTKLYLLGYGEGDNQLTVKSVNNGLPYLLAPQAYIDRYGLISKVYVDRAFEDAASLLERGRALLKVWQEPVLTGTIKVADLHAITRQDYDKAEIGRTVLLTMDGTRTFITGITRNHDVPGDMALTLSTQPEDLASMIADLAGRQRIEQVYSQGATQVYGQSVQTNGDTKTPAVLQFYLPQALRIVNKVVAKITLDPYRTYSKVTRGGGGSTQTSSDGGGASVASGGGGESSQTSSASGQAQVTSGPSSTTTSGQHNGQTGYMSTEFTDYIGTSTKTAAATGNMGTAGGDSTGASTGYTASADGPASHSHGLGNHTHVTPQHSHTLGSHEHSFEHLHRFYHTHSIAHAHSIDHTHTVTTPSHTHSVSVPSHSHNVSISGHSHSVTVPEHTHDIEQGISRFGNPKGAQIQINGETKATMALEKEIDLTPLLVGSNGTIPRDAWIKLGVLPDDLAYITIDISVMGFVQSRGGGTY